MPLEKPYEGLYVANNMWREMYDFSPDAVLMVLASELYNEEDYIRDYDVFLEMVRRDEAENHEDRFGGIRQTVFIASRRV